MFNKKLGGLSLLAVTAVMALAGCGGGGEGGSDTPTTSDTPAGTSEVIPETGNIDIWCPESDTVTMGKIVDAFKAAYPAYEGWTMQVTENVGEGEVGGKLIQDYNACADVMLAADDNLRQAVNASTIVALNDEEKATVVAESGQSSVDAVSINGVAYGYPYRADNGYVLIYDDTVLGESDITSFETLVQKATAAGKDVFFPIANSWYGPSYFWAAGGYFIPTPQEDGTVTLESNFGTEAVAQGPQAIADLYKTYGSETAGSGHLVPSDNKSTIENGFRDGTAAACVLWNDVGGIEGAVTAEGAVGGRTADNIKCAALPTLNCGGTAKAMQSFNGFKCAVVNLKAGLEASGGSAAKLIACKRFAAYIGSAAAQKIYLDELGYGPCAISLADDPALASNKFLTALATMTAAGHTVGQGANVTENFWTPVENFGKWIVNNKGEWGTYGTALGAINGIIMASTGWTAAA